MKIIILSSFFCLIISFLIAQNEKVDQFLLDKKLTENFRNDLETFCEPSTISGSKFFDYHSGIKKAYLLNAEFQLPVTISLNNHTNPKKNIFFHNIQMIPGARIRIFKNDPAWGDKSKPVRTPSFCPKIYYLISNKKFWNEDNKHHFYLGVGILHHSNGQDGTEFVDFTDTVNLYNGSFSEAVISHFLIGGKTNLKIKKANHFNKIVHKLEKLNISKIYLIANEQIKTLFWKFGYEFHPHFFANRKFDETGVYGGNRMFVNLGLSYSNIFDHYFYENMMWNNSNIKTKRENIRFTLNFEYITDLTYNSGGYKHLQKIKLLDAKKRANIVLTCYKRILHSKFPALFAQLAYFGSDNYNIYFQKSMFQARIGFAFGFFQYEKL